MWRFIRTRPAVPGAFVLLLGLALLIGGLELIRLVGSWYCAIAGFGLTVAGALLLGGRAAGYWIYAIVFAGTWVWALSEVGIAGWQLMPRIVIPAVLGLWLSMPWVVRTFGRSPRVPRRMWLSGALVCALSIALVIALGYWISAKRWLQPGAVSPADLAVPAPDPALADGDWRWYGRDAQGTRFAPLKQITPDNVHNLKSVWTFHTGDLPRSG